MFKRVYGIKLKPDLPPGSADELVRVLENTGAYIPGTVYSIVRPTIGPGPFDFVWDNAFVDAEHYQGYLAHPYHCNVIDQYMYREAPSAVIADSLVIRWSDDLLEGSAGRSSAPTPVPAVPARRPDDGLPAQPMPGDPSEGPLVIVETVELLPGCTDAYLAALKSHYLPMIEGRGLTLLNCMRSPAGTGEEEIVILWQVASWQNFVEYRAFFQFENEPASTDWVNLVATLRKGGRRRMMLPALPGKAV